MRGPCEIKPWDCPCGRFHSEYEPLACELCGQVGCRDCLDVCWSCEERVCPSHFVEQANGDAPVCRRCCGPDERERDWYVREMFKWADAMDHVLEVRNDAA